MNNRLKAALITIYSTIVFFLSLGIVFADLNAGPIDFDSFMNTYKSADPSSRKDLADSYISKRMAHGGFPIVSPDGSVVFLYQGNIKDQKVSVVGEFKLESFYSIAWDKAGIAMTPLSENSDLYFAKIQVEPDARLEYQFVIDGDKQLDPLNVRKVFNGVTASNASEFVMPKYPVDMTQLNSPSIAKGVIHPIVADWLKAPINVYFPANYRSDISYPVVYTADGSAWDRYMDLRFFPI